MSKNNIFKTAYVKTTARHKILSQSIDISNRVIYREKKFSVLTDQQLLKKTYEMSAEIQAGKSVNFFLIDALAIAREMIWRVHKLKAFKAQIIGAVVAHFGDFAEMRTGEGKTLTLLLVSFVNALEKKGVHIVTVNEYLVERDKNFSHAALSKLGISVGFVLSSMQPNEKKRMYDCDITYISNSELGFDYLRDNMVANISEKMQRGLHFAIVDEGDSILIDESRTPLIIAGAPDSDISMYIDADIFVKTLMPTDYVIDAESEAINLNDNGINKAQSFFRLKNLYDIENSDLVHRIINSLKANYIMEYGKQYIVQFDAEKDQDDIALVDNFTGRILHGRMYSAGLHQAIQAKERLAIEPENRTVATITYQSLFRLYKKIAALSGTALTEQLELLKIYNMVVVQIPTNEPIIREDHSDYIFANRTIKWKFILADIIQRHKKGQPILVGTASVDESEILSKLLIKLNVVHNVLNAKNNAQEASIISKAGEIGAITIATNMAGRGTDIKLGKGVIELGGLFVLGTERNESRRIDNQLRGRAGRQGDPGSSRFFISLQDSLFKRFATDKFDKAQYKLGDEVLDLKFFSRLLTKTQKKVENMNYDIRKNLIDYDYVLGEQREFFYNQRNLILKTNELEFYLKKMILHVINNLIAQYRNVDNIFMIDVKDLITEINKKYLESKPLNINQFEQLSEQQIKNKIIVVFNKFLNNKINIEENREFIISSFRKIIISSMDSNWTTFLDRAQKIRDGVSLRSYEQKSPLNIYVEDSDRLFHAMSENIAIEVIASIFNHTILTSSAIHQDIELKDVFQPTKATDADFSMNEIDITNERSINDLQLSIKEIEFEKENSEIVSELKKEVPKVIDDEKIIDSSEKINITDPFEAEEMFHQEVLIKKPKTAIKKPKKEVISKKKPSIKKEKEIIIADEYDFDDDEISSPENDKEIAKLYEYLLKANTKNEKAKKKDKNEQKGN